MDKETKREIILDNYQHPTNRGLKEDESYVKANTRSDSCIDNIDLMMKIEDGKVVDACFDGEACAICTSATSIIVKSLIGKSVDEAKEIISNYQNMINEEKYNPDILGELNVFDEIYMPQPNIMRIEYNGQWYEIEQIAGGEIKLPEDVKNIKTNSNFKVTEFVKDPLTASGYSAVTFTDYFLKIFSSISPSHEETIDELMLSQGADTVNIFIKFTWLPKYPFTFAKKYYHNIRTPNNGPLSNVKSDLKKKLD